MFSQKLILPPENPRPVAFASKPMNNEIAIAAQKPLPSILVGRLKALLKQRDNEHRLSAGVPAPPPTTDEIVQIYELLLSELICNLKPIITDLIIIAEQQREHATGITDAICSRILEYKKVVRAYMTEAKWLNNNYKPTIEEYLNTSTISCGYTMLAISSYIGMGDTTTKNIFRWATNKPKILKATSIICRLMDDIVSNECCMRERLHLRHSLHLRFIFVPPTNNFVIPNQVPPRGTSQQSSRKVKHYEPATMKYLGYFPALTPD
ncbi:hypothetical protein Fmac_021351 [Flemingia macrophylla]|uniref:Terpene synthase metal-binding domain-containing protein n=1 Tax=Flemingia macrophylla TaxID=520843 RepID=A0ABD1LWR6_9FABA